METVEAVVASGIMGDSRTVTAEVESEDKRCSAGGGGIAVSVCEMVDDTRVNGVECGEKVGEGER
jgi:hypothetical protein